MRTLKPTVRPLHEPSKRIGGSADKRAPYSVRTRRRLKLWTQDPHCKACRVLTDYPYGFELDHITPLSQGGSDTEQNSQVLCLSCHTIKTAAERRGGLFLG